MIHKLHLRLTLIFSVLTSLVLAAAVFTAGGLACRQYKTGMEALFASAFASLQDKLKNNDSLSDTWLAQQEQNTMSVIYIEDNGAPLHFSGSGQAERAALILSARQQLADNADFSAAAQKDTELTFLLESESGVSYRCAACLFWRSRGARAKSVLLLMLQDGSAVSRHLARMAFLYAGLWALGTAALSLVGWYLTGLALRPTRLALSQQNEFIAAASHELRSPLTVIKTSLEAARETDGVSPEAAAFLRSAEGEADRMKLLTDDLLILAGGDAHVWRMAPAPVPLDTFCIELYDEYQPVAHKQGHALTLSLPDDALPTVSADGQRLRQLFAILLNNAFEYAPTGTPIELTARSEGAAAVLSVADHGRGIPDSEKANVFRRFYRSDRSRTEKAHFGLGLSVAKEIADMHHARLSIQDTPGGGATFVLRFPPAENPAKL